MGGRSTLNGNTGRLMRSNAPIKWSNLLNKVSSKFNRQYSPDLLYRTKKKESNLLKLQFLFSCFFFNNLESGSCECLTQVLKEGKKKRKSKALQLQSGANLLKSEILKMNSIQGYSKVYQYIRWSHHKIESMINRLIIIHKIVLITLFIK